MKILSLNIRLSQGGAGRVAWDLHQRLKASGTESRFAYGYASGIADDAVGADKPDVFRLAHKPVVMANYGLHRLIGRDCFVENRRSLLQLLADADVVHMHAVHHYFIDTTWLLRTLARLRKPTVLTAHDWWYITGRCAFVGNCRAWAAECGQCGTYGDKGHLPALLDFSRTWRRQRREALAALAPTLTIAAPSRHLMADFQSTLGGIDIRYLPNTYDSEFEELLAEADQSSPLAYGEGRPVILVIAADLSHQQKTDAAFVRQVVELTNGQLVTVGKNSPFSGENVINHGYVGDRRHLASIIRGAHYLLYSSVVDNAPLTLIETLSLGTPVIGRRAPATSELLAAVGASTIDTVKEAVAHMRNPWPSALYPDAAGRSQLAAASQMAFSPATWVEGYKRAYAAVLDYKAR